MRPYNHGRFQQQESFLRQQFLQDGDFPFTDVLSEGIVSQALTAIEFVWLDRIFSPLVTLWVFLGHRIRHNRKRWRTKWPWQKWLPLKVDERFWPSPSRCLLEGLCWPGSRGARRAQRPTWSVSSSSDYSNRGARRLRLDFPRAGRRPHGSERFAKSVLSRTREHAPERPARLVRKTIRMCARGLQSENIPQEPSRPRGERPEGRPPKVVPPFYPPRLASRDPSPRHKPPPDLSEGREPDSRVEF
jgi:hypothetical protein